LGSVPHETQIPKYVELMQTGTKQRIQAEGPGSPIGERLTLAQITDDKKGVDRRLAVLTY
jgi:hypothetical protein